MSANPYALVPLEVASRETGYTVDELSQMIMGPDIEVHGATDGKQHMIMRHSIEKLKARGRAAAHAQLQDSSAPFGGPGQP